MPLSMRSAFTLVAITVFGMTQSSAQVTISSANGYSVLWNNNQYWNSTAPTNLALASGTANAFGSGQLNGLAHAINNINDGLYGNSESWIPNTSTGYVGVRFTQAADVTSFAWSRDNTATPAYADRSVGSYTVQFTTVASPGTATLDSDWTTVATVTLGVATGDYRPSLRHEFTITDANGRPISGVTGMRIQTGASFLCLDELSVFRQVYRTNGSGSLFGTGTYATAAAGGTTTSPYIGDILAISATTSAPQALTLGGSNNTVRALRFTTSDAVNLTAGGTNSTLTLGYVADVATGTTAGVVAGGKGNMATTGGTTLTLDAAAGALTIGSASDGEQVAIALNASNTWVNNSFNTLTVNNGVSRFSIDGLSRTLTIAGSGSTLIAGTITDGGTAGTLSVTKSGAGTLTLAGTNSYSGTTTITQGVLAISSTAALPGFATPGSYSVAAGAVLAVGNAVDDTAVGQMLAATNFASGALLGFDTSAGDRTHGAAVTGSIGVIKLGANSLTLSASNGWTGGTTIAAGTVVVGNTAALGATTGALAVTGGTLDLRANSLTVGLLNGSSGATITSNTTGSVTLTTDSGDIGTYAGAITNGSGTVALAKSGAGTLTLSGSNSHFGGTILNAGRINIDNASALGSGTFTIAGTSTIDNTSGSGLTLFTNNPQAWNANFTFAGSSPLDLGTGGLTLSANRIVTVTSSTLTTGGTYGGTLTLTKAGAGTLALTGSSVHTGTISVTAGVLQLGNTGTAARSTVTFPNTAGVSLQLTGTAATVGVLTGGGATGGGVNLGGATLTVSHSGADSTYSGVISGTGTLIRAGSGIWRMNAVQTFTGSAAFNSGVTALNFANTLPAGTVVSVNGGSVDLTADAHTWAGLSGASGGIYSFGAAGQALTLNVAGGTSYTFSGSLGFSSFNGPNFSIVKDGAGTQILNGNAATYSRGTTLNSGTLGFANNSLGTTGTITVNGGVLRWETGNTQDLSARLALVSGSTATFDTNGNNVTFATGFGGNTSGAITKIGSGRLLLSGSNSYSGGTLVNGGTLIASHANAFGGGDVTVASGATLDLGNLAIGNPITNNGGQLLGLGLYSGTQTIQGVTSLSGTIGGAVNVSAGGTLKGSEVTFTGAVAIGSGGIHSPGNSPGVETFEAGLSYTAGSTLTWELWNNTDVMGTSPNYNFDQLTITGGVLSISDLATFAISFGTLEEGSTVDFSDSFWNASRSWKVIDVVGPGASWNSSLFGTFAVGNDATGATLASKRPGAAFSLTPTDGDLYVAYVIVPEPASAVIAGIGTAMAAWMLRRRCRALRMME